jgi:hypothetical protein
MGKRRPDLAFGERPTPGCSLEREKKQGEHGGNNECMAEVWRRNEAWW